MTDAVVASTATDLDVLRLVRATILVTDRFGTIMRAHGGTGRPLGYASGQLEGHNALEFIAPKDHQVMADMFLGSEGLPIVTNPEPFPIHIVGPDGVSRVWDCVPGGFAASDVDGWIATLTCREEQNPSIAAMDCFVSGGTPVEIATAVASRYSQPRDDGWRKSALVVHRSIQRDGSVSEWRVGPPPDGSDIKLVEALSACVNDSAAAWNHIGPGDAQSGCLLPVELDAAARAAALPYCTMLASGIHRQTHIVLVRFSNFEYQLQGNNKLADHAIDSVLRQALEAELANERLAQAMRTDPLTGIANRLHFEEVVKSTPNASRHAALFVDIDRFKTVNDTFGHGVGDAALREVATRLADACRPHDVVARIGGDEFGIILRDVSDADAWHIANRVQQSMHAPFNLAEGLLRISVTVGIALHSQDDTLEELVRRADHAMLADKATSRHTLA